MRTTRLYLSSWKYNCALILQNVEKDVLDNGGEIVSTYGIFNRYEISNRTLDDVIRQTEQRHILLESKGHTIAPQAIEELERIKAIENEPKLVDHMTSIEFILDDVYYYLSLDDNPFFPFHLMKVKVQNHEYLGDYYMDEIEKEWLYDCCFKYTCNDAERKEIANLIMNQMLTAKFSKRANEFERKRIPNIYDGGYHYENVPTPQRKKKLVVRQAQ